MDYKECTQTGRVLQGTRGSALEDVVQGPPRVVLHDNPELLLTLLHLDERQDVLVTEAKTGVNGCFFQEAFSISSAS